MLRATLIFLTALPLAAQWAVTAANEYRAIPNITYLTANGYDAKLDVYARTDTATLRPVLVNIHGGGWVNGTKEGDLFHILPWIEMGWNVVNVADADRNDYSQTIVVNYNATDALVQQLSTSLGLEPNVSSLKGIKATTPVDLRIVVGKDLLLRLP